MPGDERSPNADPARGEHPRSTRSTLLNPLYMLVCELAARRGLAVPPLGRVLELPLGDGWWADLSTDCTTHPAAMISPYGLRLRHGVVSVHVGPFTPASADPLGMLERRVRAALHIARAAEMTGISEDLLYDNAASLARCGLDGLVVSSPEHPVWHIVQAATLLQRIP